VINGAIKVASYLRKNEDLRIDQALKVVSMCLPPLFSFSAPLIRWPEADFKILTAVWLRAYKNAWNIGCSTTACLLTFLRENGGLQVKLPLVTLFDSMWGNLERCHQFDDGTRQMMRLTYQEALTDNACSNLLELQKEAGLLSWNTAGENEFTFACYVANKLEIEVVWEPFNEYTISSTPNITLVTLFIRARLQLSVQILGEQVLFKCLSIEAAGIIVTTTDHGRLYSLQIDGQSRDPGLPSLREAIATTFGVTVWLAQLPGFPSARLTEDEIDRRPAEGTEGTESGDDSDEVIELTSPNERGSDVDEGISDDEQGNPDMPSKGWTGLKTTRLNDGSHRVIKLAIGSPSATSGDIQMGEELTHVDDIKVSNLLMKSIDVLLSGPPDSNIRLHLINLGGVGRDVFLNRIAWDKPLISWSRAVYPLRMRSQELEKSILPPDGQVAPARSEAEKLELLQLQEGETVFLNVRKILTSGIFPTFDTIPRAHATINTTRSYTPKVNGLSAKNEANLNVWLSWLSRNNKLVANLKFPNARAPALPSALQGGTTRKQRTRNLGKIQAEFTRLTSVVGGHPLPIVKNSSLLVELSVAALQRGVQELRDTCKIDGIPFQEESATDIILETLTKAVEATQSILLQLEEEHTVPLPSTTEGVGEVALNLSRISAGLKESESAISAAADGRATIRSLLRRLVKKCKQYPHLKQQLRSWWESAQDLLPEEVDEARRGHHTVLLEEVESNWDLPNWASNVEQFVSQYGHALPNIQPLPKLPSRDKSHQYGGTSYIDMQKVGCTLMKNVRETRQSLPTGFRRRDSAPESHLTLIKLAELLRDLSRPECRADSDMVGLDIRTILSSEGGLVTKNIYSHSRLFRRQQVGRGKFSPLMAFDEAFGEWEARTGDCRSPALVSPGQGLTVSAADTQAITELALQGAWYRLRQRRQDKPDPLAPWHWLSPRKEWILLVTLVDKLKLPQYGWTSVANYWYLTITWVPGVPPAHMPRLSPRRTTEMRKKWCWIHRQTCSSGRRISPEMR